MDGNGLPDIVTSVNPSHLTKHITAKLYQLTLTRLVDGELDFSERHGISFVPSSNLSEYTRFIDVNGDGLLDWVGLLEVDHGSRASRLFLKLNQGDGSFAAERDLGVDISTRLVIQADDPMEPREDEEHRLAKYGSAIKSMDVNGDGRDELILPSKRIVEGCHSIPNVANGPLCGEQLYQQYTTTNSSTLRSVPSSADFSIYEYTALHFSEDANGEFTASYQSTDLVGAANHSVVVDSLGKGLQDLMFVYGCYNVVGGCSIGEVDSTSVMADKAVNKIYFNRNYGTGSGATKKDYQPHDLLTEVTNGLGAISQWQYLPLTSGQVSDFYDRNEDNVLDDEHFNFASSMYAVSSFSQSNGLDDDLNTTSYRYKGAVYNTKGRGFRGFTGITEINESNDDSEVHTEFKVKFPFSSLILQQTATFGGSTVPISLSKNDWQRNLAHQTTFGANLYHVYNASAERLSCDLDAILCDEDNNLNRSLTSIEPADIDEYGNVHKSINVTNNGFSEVKVTTENVFYEDSIDDGWFNKLNTSTVTNETISGSAVHTSILDPKKKVETKFIWTPQRQPEQVTVTPLQGGGKKTVVKTEYNLHGLPTLVKTYESGLPTDYRSVSTSYSKDGTSKSTEGYFVYQVTNDLEHTITTHSDPRTGQPIQITDANGLVSKTSYDPFGRVASVTPPAGTGQPAYSRFADCSGGCDEVFSIGPASQSLIDAGVTDVASFIRYKVTTSSAGQPESTLYKDKLNRVLVAKTQGFDGSPIFVRTEYDHLGRKVFESVPSFMVDDNKGVRYEAFDLLGRVTEKRTDEPHNQSFTVTYVYDKHQTTIQAVGSTGKTINMSRTYSGNGQLMKTTDDLDGVTEYAYDAAGNPIVLQDAKDNPIKAEYNALGQKKYVIDPNMGRKDFTYTVFGEVDTEKDARKIITDYDYDILGRLTSRKVGTILEASFEFDSATKGSTGEFCKGAIHKETREDSGSDNYSKSYGYDQYCRPLTSTTYIDDTAYQQSTQYDSFFGRVKGGQTVSGITVENRYNDLGYQTHSQNASSSYVYQQITNMDARLQVTTSQKADGILNEMFEYSDVTGQMFSVQTDTLAGYQRHRINYDYDDFGNLKLQTVENFDSNTSSVVTSKETYLYDGLHRLLTATRDIGGTQDVTNYRYDAVGNFTRKDDFVINTNGFSYGNLSKTAGGSAGPNAVRFINKAGGGTINYYYDANGNQTSSVGSNSADNKTVSYNAFNKPTSIAKGNITSWFSYGADQMRYKQIKQGQTGGNETTIYIDKSYEEISYNGVTTKRQYIGDAIITETVGGNDSGFKIGFVHRDRLNSVVTITDENGNVVDNKSYDAFGKPRAGTMASISPATLKAVADAGVTNIGPFERRTNRGFTDHEHLDDAELIHMNGRVYDYNLGRFLSVDPFIQSPGNSQSMNPYSYIMNNPLAGTDPSGYCAAETGTRIKKCMDVDIKDSESGDVIATKSVNVKHSGAKGQIINFANGALNGGSVTGLSFTENGKTTDILSSKDVSKQKDLGKGSGAGGEDIVGGGGGTSQGSYHDIYKNGSRNRQALYNNLSDEQKDSVETAAGVWTGVVLVAVPGPEDVALGVFVATKAGKWVAKIGDEAIATLRAARAVKMVTVPVEKFSKYIFREGADHGKDIAFKRLGYSKEHSEKLASIWQKQAAKAYANGNCSLGKLDDYGQRINIEIKLDGIGDFKGKTSYMKSGWMINKDGSIKLNTPFTGFTRKK